MNRRNFLKSLATAAAAFAILPSATSYTRAPWKKVAGSGIYVVNPEWLNAPYEIAFMFAPGPVEECRHSIVPVYFSREGQEFPELPGHFRLKDPFPIRQNSPGDSIPIPPIIELSELKARALKSSLASDPLPASLLKWEPPA